MTSQQIEYVLAVAEQRSFSKAAQKLYVTQPSLSQYVMNIEKQLGVQLFDRSTSPIRLTQAGEAFVRSAEQIKVIEDNLMNELSDIAEIKSGSLKIGASTFRASCLLSKSVAEFCSEHRGIEVSITEENTEQLKEMVKNGELDLFIGTGIYDSRYFHTEELAAERLYLAVPESNPINERFRDRMLSGGDICSGSLKTLTVQPVDLADFADEPLVCAKYGEFGLEFMNGICEKYGFKPKTDLTVRTVETAFSFVAAGLGISLVPDTLIRYGNILSHPCYYALDSDNVSSEIYLVSRRSGYFSKAAVEYCLTLKKLIDIGTWRTS